MDEGVSFGSHDYNIFFVLLLFSRATDFLSTWIATPNLLLEANPIARKLRWKWGIIVNFFLCVGFAFWPLTDQIGVLAPCAQSSPTRSRSIERP